MTVVSVLDRCGSSRYNSPPGNSTRCISASNAVGSAQRDGANVESTRSND